MPMYNLLENIDSYSITSESFLNCYRDEVNDDPNENNDYYYRKNNGEATKSKSFEYETKIKVNTPALVS